MNITIIIHRLLQLCRETILSVCVRGGGVAQGPPDPRVPSPRWVHFLARDAYATMSVSVCLFVRLSVTEVHCGGGACREEGRVISRYASHC